MDEVDKLANIVSRYLKLGDNIRGIPEDHMARLERFKSDWGRTKINVVRIGEYVLVYSPHAVKLAYEGLINTWIPSLIDKLVEYDKMSESEDPLFDDIDSSEQHISQLGVEAERVIAESVESLESPLLDEWDLLYEDKLARSGGALILGFDESSRIFVHQLPWFIAALLRLARGILDEDLVRTLMGFDSHPWEEPGGIVRLQGDLAVRIINVYSGSDEARDSLARLVTAGAAGYSLLKAHTIILENYTRDLLKLSTEARHLEELRYIAKIALIRALYSVLGSRVERLLESISSGAVSVSRTIVGDLRITDSIVISVSPFWLINVNGESDVQCIDECLDFVGLSDKAVEVYRSLVQVLSRSLNLDANYVVYINGVGIVLRGLNLLLERYIDHVMDPWLARSALEYSRGGNIEASSLYEKMIADRLASISLDPVDLEVRVERHTISFLGVPIRDGIVRRMLTLEYVTSILNELVDALPEPHGSGAEDLFRTLPRRATRTRRRVVKALARLLSVKSGTMYALVLDDSIEARHPEHGTASLDLSGPALVEITSLNTATRIQTEDDDLL